MDTISSIQSGGGAVVPGTVQAARDFVGRDQTIHNNFGVGPRPAPVDLATTLAHVPYRRMDQGRGMRSGGGSPIMIT